MCSSSQGDKPLNFTWLRDDVAIITTLRNSDNFMETLDLSTDISNDSNSLDSSMTINQYSAFSSILSIHNVSSRHNGKYSCCIANHAGVVQYTAVLSVSGK